MNPINDNEVKEIQLKIMDYVHKFCVENNFSYYLTGGSLIGAIRHNGYIPWDDDIDIVMFRDDYERFIDEFNKTNSKYHAYSINRDDGYNYHFCKICDTTTRLTETLIVNDIEIGINIDLFPLDKLPEGINEKRLIDRLHRLDKLMFGKTYNLKKLNSRPVRQRLLILLYRLLACFYSKHQLGRKQFEIAQEFSNTDCDRYSIITCQITKKFPIITRSNTVPILHEFEGRKYMIPNTYDSYLTDQFGDYMKLPPVENRVTHHHFTAEM